MSIDIWQVIVVLASLATAVLPVMIASGQKRLPRIGFAVRTLSAMVFITTASFFFVANNELVALGSLVGSIGLWVLFILWSVHRAQDAGLSRWWCVLISVPVAGLILWAVLLFWSHEEQAVRERVVFD